MYDWYLLGVPVDAKSITSRKRPSDESLEDPRPAKFCKVSGYQDYVRSLLINYCSMTSEDITLRYLFGKANIQVAAVNHYYTRIPVTEYWVDEANKRLRDSRFGEICKLTLQRNITKLCQNLMSVNNAMQNSALAHGKNYGSKALRSFESRYSYKTRPVGLCILRSKLL
ncbi:uncharacterized protein [Magallana gigas]|uniref:uncharacterized protein n=1 Tax=Magallana gigas TaxID=29159 RepID=UPI003340E723